MENTGSMLYGLDHFVFRIWSRHRWSHVSLWMGSLSRVDIGRVISVRSRMNISGAVWKVSTVELLW